MNQQVTQQFAYYI